MSFSLVYHFVTRLAIAGCQFLPSYLRTFCVLKQCMMEAGEYTMRRFAQLYGLTYLGMTTIAREADALAAKIGRYDRAAPACGQTEDRKENPPRSAEMPFSEG